MPVYISFYCIPGAQAIRNARDLYGPSNRSIIVDDPDCSGDENNILGCNTWMTSFSECTYEAYAGVKCQGEYNASTQYIVLSDLELFSITKHHNMLQHWVSCIEVHVHLSKEMKYSIERSLQCIYLKCMHYISCSIVLPVNLALYIILFNIRQCAKQLTIRHLITNMHAHVLIMHL